MLKAFGLELSRTRKSVSVLAIAAAFCGLAVLPVQARITAEQAALLGGDQYTPTGAERAGNADGTIPPWTGGITQPPAGFDKDKDNYINPFADEEPLFIIDSKNYKQYAEKLTLGHQALFERYPDSYYMKVFPSHRTHALPQWVYDATKVQAQNVELCGDSIEEIQCVRGHVPGGGIAFPFPEHPMHHWWNTLTNFKYGKHSDFPDNRLAIVTANGSFAYNLRSEQTIWPWYLQPDEIPQGDFWHRNGGAVWGFGVSFSGGPRMVGTVLGGLQYKEDVRFDGYIYLPGQRRVRKAPELGYYDQPGTGSDGLIPTDMRWGFFMSGDEQWFDWKVLGKQEIYVPYNNYDLLQVSLHDDPVPLDDLIKPGHIDQQYTRYELHRVWVLEGKVRPEFRHLTPHIIAYNDEDAWITLNTTRYDKEGRLWRVWEGPVANFYDVPTTSFVGEMFYDVLTDRYATIGFPHGYVSFDPVSPDHFTPSGIRKLGLR